LDGLQAELAASGVDVGARAEIASEQFATPETDTTGDVSEVQEPPEGHAEPAAAAP
ncbi:MAG: 30S ribosomal protein S2, partial [Alphaproteobacteria bacterium]|nr:30S ribosomal protein S2 [Alphaproteobacteria bacterium]